jgi:hypothetical protein
MFDDLQRRLQRAEIYERVCTLADQLHELLCQWADADPDVHPDVDEHRVEAPRIDDRQLPLPLRDPGDVPF